MDDNLLKHEGLQQKMASDDRDQFDITELSAMLCDLDAVATQVRSISGDILIDISCQ